LCLRYSGTLLECESSGSLSAGAIATLEAAGIHSLSAPVDATNLSNLEIGQPTHAFDADTIDGAIVIRVTEAGEQAWPLFQEQKVELPEGTLVIADNSKILAVAGVIGCEESKTTEHTKRLLLESATFDPIAVRKASRALNIHTDSSARFERGADPTLALVGAGRVAHLLVEEAGWRHVGPTGLVGDWKDPNRCISISLEGVNAFLATDLTADEVASRLSRYGFQVTVDQAQPIVFLVRIPPHRLWDVEFPADLYEELAKSIGYNATPISLPKVDMGSLPREQDLRKLRAEDVLIGHGFYEVFTNGFYGRDTRALLGISEGHPLWRHVETTNARDRDYSLLKNNCLGQALEAVSKNMRMRHDEIKAYEWTRTFHPNEQADNGVCTETDLLWGIVNGADRAKQWAGVERPADPLFLKGVLEELATELGLGLKTVPLPPEYPIVSLLHPRRSFGVAINGELAGAAGEIHPVILKAYKIKRARPCYFEIDAKALLGPGKRPVYVEPPSYHPVIRSLAFTLPHGIAAGEIERCMSAAAPPSLSSVQIVDEYRHEGAGAELRTITYELTFANPDFSITAEEVNGVAEQLIEEVHREFGGRDVKLR
jgi:phenylalanyl-tRNA synthetase beta chain